jgi:hypothetical protein
MFPRTFADDVPDAFHDSNDTHILVRIRYPDEFMRQAKHPTPLSLDMINFGVLINFGDYPTVYKPDEGDNGYTVFSHLYRSRVEAETIENIIKIDFCQINAVKGSRQYVNTTELAKLLHVNFNGTYESYEKVAQAFFLYIVRRTRALWPDHYEGIGLGYVIRYDGPMEMIFRRTKFLVSDEESPK